jgi:hypothetical protein
MDRTKAGSTVRNNVGMRDTGSERAWEGSSSKHAWLVLAGASPKEGRQWQHSKLDGTGGHDRWMGSEAKRVETLCRENWPSRGWGSMCVACGPWTQA